MANNVLTALAPTLFAAGKAVPREVVGVVAATNTDFDAQGVSQGSTVTVPVAPAQAIGDVTPSQAFTAGTGRTASSKSVTLANFKETSWNLNAEEERLLLNGGVNATEMFRQTVEQGWRILANTIEANAWAKCYVASSRAIGTAGTTPFATTTALIPSLRKILIDNGVSVNSSDCSLVIDTDASANLLSLTQLTDVNRAGGDQELRRGVLRDLFGFSIRESAQIGIHTKGTATGYDATAAFAIGAETITVDGSDAGTILAGDITTWVGDTNKYVIGSATASGAASGNIVLNNPGLRAALADTTEGTTGASYTANLALHRNAAVTVVRPGLQPEGAAAEQMVLTDPVTGLSCLMLRVPGNAMASYYMRIVYDTSVINSHQIATLLG